MNFQINWSGVLNEKIEVGVAMNALAHMVVGLGASVETKDDLRLTNYVDADGNCHSHISEIPFMVLISRNSNQIRTYGYR